MMWQHKVGEEKCSAKSTVGKVRGGVGVGSGLSDGVWNGMPHNTKQQGKNRGPAVRVLSQS